MLAKYRHSLVGSEPLPLVHPGALAKDSEFTQPDFLHSSTKAKGTGRDLLHEDHYVVHQDIRERAKEATKEQT